MTRSKVVIHMYVSIDGKIDGPHSSSASSAYYSDELFKMSNADANGRETIQMYAAPATLDLSDFEDAQIPYEDWLPEIESDTWSVSFDRQGKCGWTQNFFDYNGHQMHAIEVVTKQASQAYLAFLQSMNIPYIIGGETEFDFETVLEKLYAHFNIETLAVCGGAMINGAFLKAHVVDQISLVIAPHVNGDENKKASFETVGQYVDDTFAFDQAKKLSDGGVHLIFKK
ncbi:dihydrofolate reductase family protein [Weissella sagaensis]|uniref:dihydrofolate reductase family protein n=1 Tax=Weissella sagaensis TaxID=2559928 RepID=UPI001C1F8BF6|nr:dihydrofolate reductase family protein [Weissella sagaensis]MBU7568371.1 dihydrofolate reductase family protein [Weissella hellenica]